jgi:hypothetical protein
VTQYDIFLSYKSDDGVWVEKLRGSLEHRGVRVWLDKDSIRPEDLFPEALEEGIRSSRCVGVVITPASMLSNWVREEYNRALILSNNRGSRIIPILLREAEIPGFLASRQFVDFRREDRFEQAVDKLVWPGITGKHVIFYCVAPLLEDYRDRTYIGRWEKLHHAASTVGLRIPLPQFPFRALYMLSMELGLATPHPLTDAPSWTFISDKRVVFVLDVFGEHGVERRFDPRATDDSNSMVSFLADIERRGAGTPNEPVVVLYHDPAKFDMIAPKLRATLANYFTIPFSDGPDDTLQLEIQRLWPKIQRDLLRGKPYQPIVTSGLALQ